MRVIVLFMSLLASSKAFLVPTPLRRSLTAMTSSSKDDTAPFSIPASLPSFLPKLAIASLLSSFVLPSAFMPPLPALADGATTRFILPPVDMKDTQRCQFKSSNMGQANAARDKLYDLRFCDMSGKDAAGFDLSGAIMAEGTFTGVNFKEAVLSKAYAKSANFENADFSNAVVDRASFDGSKMKGSIFSNAVLSGTSFAGADLTDSDFTDTYMGEFDLKNLCKNPTLSGTNPKTQAPTKESAGCK
ncbi:Hypothetical protein NocV09_02600140 [Nannochloropsis oceanica]